MLRWVLLGCFWAFSASSLNIALNRPATCSSPLNNGKASAVVDNNSLTCLNLNTNADAFVEVFLGPGAQAASVFLVGVSQSVTVSVVDANNQITACTSVSLTNATCPNVGETPYVVVAGSGYLSLCDVQVFGTQGSPTAPAEPNLGALSLSGVAPYGSMNIAANGPAERPSTQGDFSIQFFARRTGTLDNMMVVSQGAYACTNSNNCCPNGACFVVGWRRNDQVVFNIHGSNLITCNAYPNLGWHRWTFVYDRVANTRYIYRDFELQAVDTPATRSANRPSITGPVTVGQDVTEGWTGVYGSFPFRGQIDHFRWFNRALQADEIAYTAAFLAFPYLLRVRLDFENSNALGQDTSGNGNDMTIAGTANVFYNTSLVFNFTDGGPPVVIDCGAGGNEGSSSLSGGAIAGIVIGSLAGVCLISLVCYKCCCDESRTPSRNVAKPMRYGDGEHAVVAVPLTLTQQPGGYYNGQQPVMYPPHQQQAGLIYAPQAYGAQQPPAVYGAQPQPMQPQQVVYSPVVGAGYGGTPLGTDAPPAYEAGTSASASGFDANGYPLKASAPAM